MLHLWAVGARGGAVGSWISFWWESLTSQPPMLVLDFCSWVETMLPEFSHFGWCDKPFLVPPLGQVHVLFGACSLFFGGGCCFILAPLGSSDYKLLHFAKQRPRGV